MKTSPHKETILMALISLAVTFGRAYKMHAAWLRWNGSRTQKEFIVVFVRSSGPNKFLSPIVLLCSE